MGKKKNPAGHFLGPHLVFALRLKSCLLNDPQLLCVWARSSPCWRQLCAAQWCFPPFSVEQMQGWRELSPLEAMKLSWVFVDVSYTFASSRFCAMGQRDPFSGLYLSGWSYDFNTINKFRSQSFKNTLMNYIMTYIKISLKCLFEEHCPHCFYHFHPAVEQLSPCYEKGHGLDWAGIQGFAWNISSCPLFKNLGLSPLKSSLPCRLGSPIMFMAGRPRVFVEVEETCWEPSSCWWSLERFFLKVLVGQKLIYKVSLGLSFLAVKREE